MNQLKYVRKYFLLDIYLSTGNVVEPHIHQNAAELVYCISGSAVVSFTESFTNQILNLPIKPGQASTFQKLGGIMKLRQQMCTHLLAIFDAPTPEVIFGSDIFTINSC